MASQSCTRRASIATYAIAPLDRGQEVDPSHRQEFVDESVDETDVRHPPSLLGFEVSAALQASLDSVLAAVTLEDLRGAIAAHAEKVSSLRKQHWPRGWNKRAAEGGPRRRKSAAMPDALPGDPPSSRELDVLRALHAHGGELPPTYRDVGAALGMGPSRVFQHAKRLAQKGLVQPAGHRSRATRLTDTGLLWVAAETTVRDHVLATNTALPL